MDINDKILIFGANGMVGRALTTKLQNLNYKNLFTPRSVELNLLDTVATEKYMSTIKPDYCFFLAAKVGGIMANIAQPGTFGYDNAMMELNVINSCKNVKIKKMLYIGSSCIYPRLCPQPMKEEYLMTSPLEPTNEMYAISKIMGLKLCEAYNKEYGTNYISCMPCNLYGQHDNFDPKRSHVMSAMIKRFHDAKTTNLPHVTCFGTGSAYREFMHVDDAVNGCLFLMNNYNDNSHINLGVGKDITIYNLAHLVKDIVGYNGTVEWDVTKPDGMPRKVLDVQKINNLGWKSTISLEDGIRQTYDWYLKNI